jgi:hypothetical protein
MARVLLALVFLFTCGVAAANNEDGFIWVDANTKIRIQPIGKTGTAATGGTAAPQPKKEPEKKEAPKK